MREPDRERLDRIERLQRELNEIRERQRVILENDKRQDGKLVKLTKKLKKQDVPVLRRIWRELEWDDIQQIVLWTTAVVTLALRLFTASLDMLLPSVSDPDSIGRPRPHDSRE